MIPGGLWRELWRELLTMGRKNCAGAVGLMVGWALPDVWPATVAACGAVSVGAPVAVCGQALRHQSGSSSESFGKKADGFVDSQSGQA